MYKPASFLRFRHLFTTSSRRSTRCLHTLPADADCSPDVKDLHGKFTAEVEGKRTVPLSLLRNILEECQSPRDLEVAFGVLQDYRVHRSSKCRVKQNFNENIAKLTVSASLRTKSYDLGLKCLWKHNIYGLSPTIKNAHQFLGHAKETGDINLMKKAYRTMLKNSLVPTTTTADIMIRICKQKGDMQLMFDLAHEFLENGVKLNPAIFDILISTAATHGSLENVTKAQKWREEAGLDHTIASAFAVAKAHILEGKPVVGADLIAMHCQDKVKLNKYLTMLVKVWPSELLERKEQIDLEVPLEDLKENVVSFVTALSKKFSGVKVNIEEFGKGNPKIKDDFEDCQQLSAVS